MSDESWRPVHDPFGTSPDHPRDYDAIEIWREEWSEPQATKWANLHPMMNVIGLQWRPISERRHTLLPNRLQPSSALSSSQPLLLNRVFGL